MITVVVPPGIGDIYWLLMKVVPNTDQKIKLKVCHADNKRAHFLKYLDAVEEVVEDPKTSFLRLRKLCWGKNYKSVQAVMYMEANTWLEAGKRIEDYYPHFKTEHKLKWNITDEGRKIAQSYLKPGMNNVALFTSCYAHNKQENVVGDWKPEHWVTIVEHMYRTIPDLNIIWLGAPWDTDMIKLLEHFPSIQFMTNQPADAVITVLRETQCFVAYQSGLSVISICEEIPTYMAYFDRLDPMHYAYAPKETMHDKLIHKPMAFRHLKHQLEYPALWAAGVISSRRSKYESTLKASARRTDSRPSDTKSKVGQVERRQGDSTNPRTVLTKNEKGYFRNITVP